ncbi:cell envelope integrity protein CreD [Fulvivirga sp. 29W222]|uniref:Cell envelope integrity protein CreD n=1 Tax=Fulvivirga marina TaxID=2494733 RepID=A0A937FWY8_9BACT|nr:cell envelope integrity protein CreD [Fulvivirga marina]MBL6446232.1 cell envelope integrity protein CreD [Fulvivirga marina]
MQESETNTISKISSGIKNSIMVKLIAVAVIALLLLIPASSIESLIYERQLNRDIAIQEVSNKWGGAQILAGPILNIPYREYHKNKDGELRYTVHYAHFLPKSLNIDGKVDPERRKRGIYEIVLYNTKLQFSGTFEKPDFSIWSIDSENVHWGEAYISIGIPDMSGIQKDLTLKWNGKSHVVESGLPEKEVISSGLISRVSFGEGKVNNFEFSVDLNGSGQLSFVPLGKRTLVNLVSPWPDPSFNGEFLPDKREVTIDGFKAEWEVLDLNRNYPQQWLGNTQNIQNAAFGVGLILPVDEYQKNMRSVKYAILVIALSFIIFFLIEILNRKRFHPFQYVMVGLVIVLFYSLLISFTEHMGFNLAYMISSILVIGLIAIYVAAVFKSRKLTILVTILLTVIYFFIFVILQLQDFALLVGSLGLFAALASLMYLSRHINWYELNTRTITESN